MTKHQLLRMKTGYVLARLKLSSPYDRIGFYGLWVNHSFKKKKTTTFIQT